MKKIHLLICLFLVSFTVSSKSIRILKDKSDVTNTNGLCDDKDTCTKEIA